MQLRIYFLLAILFSFLFVNVKADTISYNVIPNNAEYLGGQWSGYITQMSNWGPDVAIDRAKAYAQSNPDVTYFFISTGNLYLGNHGRFPLYEAVFFTGLPHLAPAPGLATAYLIPERIAQYKLYGKIKEVLLAHYGFNANALDLGPNSLNAEVPSDVIYNWGYIGDAIQLTSSDNFVQLPEQLTSFSSNKFSFAAWVKLNEMQNPMPSNTMRSLFGLLGIDSSKKITFFMPNSSSIATSAANFSSFQSNGIISSNKWHHIVLAFDGEAGNLKFYIDKELDSTHSFNKIESGFAPWNNSAYRNPPFNSSVLMGMLDETYFFKDYLTAAQIEDLFGSAENHRSAQTLSKDCGAPLQNACKFCVSHWIDWPLNIWCNHYSYKCDDGTSKFKDQFTCSCPTGQKEVNGSCFQIDSIKPDIALQASQTYRNSYIGVVSNASLASYFVPSEDTRFDCSKPLKYFRKYCAGSNVPTVCKEFTQKSSNVENLQEGCIHDNYVSPWKCDDFSFPNSPSSPNYILNEWRYVSGFGGSKSIAINANFWDPSISPNYNPCGLPYGRLYSNGKMTNSIHANKFDTFVILKPIDGKRGIAIVEENSSLPNDVEYAVSGNLILTTDENTNKQKIYSSPSTFSWTKEQISSAKPGKCTGRTAIGYDRRSDTLFLVVVPHQPNKGTADCIDNKKGLTAYSMAQWLSDLGATEGILLDGGGSSQLYYNDESLSGATMSRPGDGKSTDIRKWVYRPIPTFFGVYLK